MTEIGVSIIILLWWNHKLMRNKQILQILSIPMLKIVPKLFVFTAWLHVHIWLFLPGNMCSNHCDVTVRFVALNANCTLNQNKQRNIHYHYSETDQNWSKWYDKVIFWKYKLFTMVELPHSKKKPLFYLMFVIIIWITVCFLKLF